MSIKTNAKRAVLGLLSNPTMLNYVYGSLRYSHDNPADVRAQLSDAARFVAWIAANQGLSASQIFQDLWVLFELSNKSNGYFVEFGALDGKKISNTYLLETRFGWKGVLAEPAPIWQEVLRKNRHCFITDKCVWKVTGETLTFDVVGDTGYSTIAEYSGSDMHSGARRSATEVAVQTISLNDLLDMAGAPAIVDFLSIDTEGSEFEILRSFDFDKHRISLICVEHNWTKNEKLLDELLAEKGFERRFPEYSQFDGWYRNKTVER